MFTSLFKRKSEYGKHTDIYPKPPQIPGDQSWMEYKQLTNDQDAFLRVYGGQVRKDQRVQEQIESKIRQGLTGA
jgi:hypothetical protein